MATPVEHIEPNDEQHDTSNESLKVTILNGKSTVINVSAAKYQCVLEKQIAFVSGAMYENCLILSVTSNGLRVLEGEDGWDGLDATINYISSILTSEQKEQGIVIVIDGRRNNQSQTVKTLIEKIASSDFPLSVHSLILYKSVSHLASIFSKNKIKLVTQEIKDKLKIIFVNDKDELFQMIPMNSLTDEFGGTLPYDHQKWIKNNVVQMLRAKILERFPDVRDGLNEFEVPQTVKDAERLMTQHLKLKEFFVNFFAEIDVCIDQLTANLLNQSEDTTHSSAATVGVLCSTDVLAFLNKTNEEVNEEQAEFDKFWAVHKSRLDHMMRMCHYKRTIEKVRHLIQGHIEDLTHTELVIGESLEVSLELGEKHEVFVSTCKEKMDTHMKDIQDEQVELSKLPSGDEIRNKVLLQDLNQVKQSVQLLTESYQELMKLCQQKRDLFIVAVKFHMSIRQCEQWCSSVKEFTEITPSDDVSPARAGQLVEETDHIMKQMTQRQINALKEFAACLPEKQVKKLTSKTINRCTSSRERLEQYKTKLLQLVALSYTPPTPPVVDTVPSPTTPSVESIPAPVPEDSSSINDKDTKSTQQDTNPLAWVPEYIDDESDPAVLRKREFIYKEVIQTEKDYIEDLKVILDSYYHEMEPEDRIPLRLRGKKSIIFGNLKELYEFHNETFLKQLELYSDHPERIGSCFIQHSSEFQLYSKYCHNRPNSEALLTESPECQSFFKEIQIRLAHQLPLNSFLIKPIQRITKYQLLLKDMIKNSANATQSLQDLQTALNIMLQVLKNLNDSLHVVGLKGFPGTLAEQGRLLVHDPFQVWEMTGHSSRNLLSRSHERHVFLFEKVLIFSKKKEEIAQQKTKEKKSDSYQYKNHLQLADIQLKDQDHDSPLSFIISLHGQNRMFKLQAASKDVRDMWVKELKRLLCNQFGLLKDVVLKSGTLDRETAAKFAKMSKRSQGKTKLFTEEIPENRYLEQKKSFSDRFKLKKKKMTHVVSANEDFVKQTDITTSNVTTSLQNRSKDILSRDDSALSASIPAKFLSSHNRAHSQDDLLKNTEGEWSDDDEDLPNMSFGGDNYEILAPGMPHYYTAIADYTPNEADQGIPLQIDQEVELIGINQYTGWWWVRATNYFTNEVLEGWVPASYLQISKVE